ncbi:hypothetical protein ACQ4PT_031188 [Festuca glaucescens]
MADTTEPLLLPAPHPKQRQPPPRTRAWGCGLTAAVLVLLLLLLAASDPLRPCCRLFGEPPEPVELTLLAGATEKGAVCLDGTPPGYHLQRGSGDGANKWLIHLEDGSILHFRGLHIYEAIIDELMRKGLANATQKGPMSPLGFKEQEGFSDIDMFRHDQAPAAKRVRTTAEVPDLFSSPQLARNAGFYKTVDAEPYQ